MTAGRTRRNHGRFRRRRQRRQQSQAGDLCAQVIMLLFVSEGAGHAATARVQHRHIQARDQPQRRRRAAHADQRFLMAVAVQHTLFLKRPQRQCTAPCLDLLRQPAVGEMRRRRDASALPSPAPIPSIHRKASAGNSVQAQGSAYRQRRAGPAPAPGPDQRPRGVQKAFAERGPAATVEVRQFNGIAGALQNAHRRSSNGRLVVRRKAVVHQQDAADSAGGGVGFMPREPAAEVVGVE